MSEDSVQIEFTDEELEGNVVDNDPQSLINNEGANNDRETNKGSESSQQTLSESTIPQNEGGDGTGAKSTITDDAETTDGSQSFKTDSELAAEHNVTEEDIKYAKSMGWSPKDKFHGSPSEWKGPKEFIDIAEQSAPVLRERLREMSKKVTDMQKVFPTILEMQKRELQNKVESLTSENEQLQKDLEEAHLLADSRKAADIVEKITENKIKKAITEEQIKHVGEKDGLSQMTGSTIVPEGIDVEKERAWRDSILPKLTLEQREIYDQAAKFVALPQNADKTTNERIAYIESKIFGRRSAPSVASVARPTTTDVTTGVPAAQNEYEGWDSLSAEEKKVATSIIEDTDWYQKKDTDPKAKAMWNDFKKQFRK